MKKAIIFICVIAVAITISSCRKRVYYYYAYCETGHSPPWEGTKREYPANGTKNWQLVWKQKIMIEIFMADAASQKYVAGCIISNHEDKIKI